MTFQDKNMSSTIHNCEEFDFDIDVYFNGEEEDEISNNVDMPEIQCIGIDLGTTTSCIAVWDTESKSVRVISDKNGNRIMPSMVSFGNFSYYVGHSAKNQRELNPTSTFYEVKRLIGKKITDPMVIADSQFFSYSLERNYEKDENNIYLCTGQQTINSGCTQYFKPKYTPEEISSIILSKLKEIAADANIKTDKVVITVPAYFNQIQRKATQDAATIAGLDCIKIIHEPTAAACAYGLEILTRDKEIDLNVIVYDLGGGTLDVSLLNISGGMIEVLGSAGDTHLGGSDFDTVLVNYCVESFIRKNKLEDITVQILLSQLTPIIKQKLKIECENMKIKLSTNDVSLLNIPDFFNNLSLQIKMSKLKYQELCNDLLLRCLKPVNDVIKDATLKIKDIDEVILVGGGTKMPMIKSALSAFFGNKVLNDHINPDEVVACGAAIHGHTLCNKKSSISDNILLLDVIPLSLGIETLNNLMSVIIPRNTTIPTSRKRKYTTCENNADHVDIKIFEGERSLTKDNFFIGSFTLEGIEPEMRGIPEIEVTFNVDANGIVNIFAQDVKNKDNKKSITVNSNTGRLTKDEINKMIEESLRLREKDKELEKKREYYYAIEDMCNNVIFNLEEIKDKISEEKIESIKQAITSTLEELKTKPFDQHKNSYYVKLHNSIKSKYGTMILKLNKEAMKFEESTSNNKIKAANVYEDDILESDFCLIQEDDIDENVVNEEDKETQELLLEAKNTLVTLCNDTLTIIMTEDTGLQYEDVMFLREYVDDCMMWLYVSIGLNLQDYNEKINEFNKTCNEIMMKNGFYNCTDDDSTNILTQDNVYELASSILDLLRDITDKTIIDDYDSTIKKLELIINNDKCNTSDNEMQEISEYLNNLIDHIEKITTITSNTQDPESPII